ncbi:MAG: IS21 family transposase, partial [Tannerella sp.]|nr:IS21 family transposase [Tannerella sp.]
MSTIKQLIQLHESGVSNRRIAKTPGLNKGTVNDYVNKLKSVKMSASELLKLDEPELEGRFSVGTAAFTDARFNDFKAELPSLEKELTRKHVTRYLLWKEYLEKYPDGYRYTQ